MNEDSKRCGWGLEDEDDYQGQDTDYSTSCSRSFMFNEGSVEDNGFKFCPFCGKRIVTTELLSP